MFIARLLSFLDCDFKVIAVLKNLLVMKWMSFERAAMTVLPEMWDKLEESCLLSCQLPACHINLGSLSAYLQKLFALK